MKPVIAASLVLALSGTALAFASPANAQVAISITAVFAPPVLPVYVQPPIPAVGYMWAPGYWAWDGYDYYWVPGTWLLPPRVGYLWTPGWWGWNNGYYVFNEGYWGQHVGFYGGINYGYGYTGGGYEGGYWQGGAFFYNRSVTNITTVNITNVYNKTVVVNPAASTTSFNGGKGGIQAQPTPVQIAAAKEPHVSATPLQLSQQTAAKSNPLSFAKKNKGVPPVLVTPKPVVTQDAVKPSLPAAALPVAKNIAPKLSAPANASALTPAPSTVVAKPLAVQGQKPNFAKHLAVQSQHKPKIAAAPKPQRKPPPKRKCKPGEPCK